MKTAAECRRQAEALETLAETEPDGFRRQAYRQMAAFWRASEWSRAADASDAITEPMRFSPNKT